MPSRTLVALGGNALLPRGKAGTFEEQRNITLQSLRPLVEELGPEDRLLLSHGNGPVIGNILIRNDAASEEIPPMPVDVCGADSQGGLGYMIASCLHDVLREAGRERPVTAVITRVRVDPRDPALTKPTKPIGPYYSPERAAAVGAAKRWEMREDSRRGEWRRVIGSPRPQEIVELPAIRTLFEAGHIVIAVGGGGIPVVVDAEGRMRGVEAVIDKDRASALLARRLGVERFVIVTAVEKVALNFGTEDQIDLDRLGLADARRHLDDDQFGVGSMRPKIESAIAFLEAGGKEVIITSPEVVGDALQGTRGTRISGA